ncbi:MAG TPA: hypothetical protein DDX71_04810 [Ruminococcus sp.]|nr:hypothetical protein [Ruminococcus sp.]
MSNRNQSAAAGVGAADLLNQMKEGAASLKENLRTQNGKRFLFVVQFLLSLVNLFYLRGVIRMAYYSMYYRLEIPSENSGRYCFLVTLACIFFGAIMIFTRRQIVTRLVILCAMPFYLPIFLFNYRYLVLVIPLALLLLVTYLASGTPEGPKTILGAVFIGLYIIGAFVFLTVQSILQPATTETVIRRDVTPAGTYRFSIVQELDQADGNTFVAIEPNTSDIEYDHSKWFAKGYTKEVYRERPLRKEFDANWITKTRAEITRELIANNPNTTFTLNAEQMKILGRDVGYGETFKISALSMPQRHKLGLANEDDSIDRRIGKFLRKELVPKDYEVTLTFDEMVALGLNPTCEIRLSKMTDDELAALGVPEENEVLIVNGKTVFRQYVAELERTFWESSRSFTAFMESNNVPEVHPEGVEIPEPETTETTTETTSTTESSETTETTAVTTTG